MTFSTIITMIAAGLVALIGLVEATHAVDAGMYVFGLVAFVFGVFLDFWLLKRHFDAEDRRGAA